MIVSVHQPNYLPWVGYFHKIALSGAFVFLDAVQYPRGQSVANRNKIKTAGGVQYLTVPISKPKGSRGKASYFDVAPADNRWPASHLKTLRLAYGRTPYFARYVDDLAAILQAGQSFVDTNIALIRYLLAQLNITTPVYRLSALAVEPGRKSELVVNICRSLNAGVYLSGQGARAYNDEALFAAHGIQLTYQQFTCPVYPQLYGAFAPNLSVVDLLFNCGPDSKQILMQAGG
ncbi:MAG: WbqC family protein [Anaerolineae bacterium]